MCHGAYLLASKQTHQDLQECSDWPTWSDLLPAVQVHIGSHLCLLNAHESTWPGFTIKLKQHAAGMRT